MLVKSVVVYPCIDKGDEIIGQDATGPTSETSFWGVYYRLEDHCIEHIEDFNTKQEAEIIAKFLSVRENLPIEAYKWEKR